MPRYTTTGSRTMLHNGQISVAKLKGGVVAGPVLSVPVLVCPSVAPESVPACPPVAAEVLLVCPLVVAEVLLVCPLVVPNAVPVCPPMFPLPVLDCSPIPEPVVLPVAVELWDIAWLSCACG